VFPAAVADECDETGRVATFDVASHGRVQSIQPRLGEAADRAWTFEYLLLEGLGRVLHVYHGTEMLLRFATCTWKSFTMRVFTPDADASFTLLAARLGGLTALA
jgi:hypothetical protein